MGLFMQRPEEPSEWAGLPSEPLRRSPTEMLVDEPPLADPASMLLGGQSGLSSVVIPAVPSSPGVAGRAVTDPSRLDEDATTDSI